MAVRVVDPKILVGASRVARVATMREVILESSTSRRLKSAAEAEKQDWTYGVRDRCELIESSDESIRTKVAYALSTGGTEDDSSGVLALMVEFLVNYDVQAGAEIDGGDLESFVQINPTYNSWPYFREFVTSVSMRMGLPGLFVESLVVAPAAKEPAPKSD